jgi:hypothetical protein
MPLRFVPVTRDRPYYWYYSMKSLSTFLRTIFKRLTPRHPYATARFASSRHLQKEVVLFC